MIKKQSKIIALLLALVLCLAPAALAATQSSLYLSSYGASVYAEGSGDIQVWFNVQATGTMDEIGALTIILQRSSTGTNWTTVKTFQYTSYANMLDYDDNFYTSCVDYSGTEGYYYRAYVTIWAGIDGSGDSRQILTSSVQA